MDIRQWIENRKHSIKVFLVVKLRNNWETDEKIRTEKSKNVCYYYDRHIK